MSNTHVTTSDNRRGVLQRGKQQRAPYLVGAGFLMFALAIVMIALGGSGWLKPSVPACMLGVLMIARGAWSIFPTKCGRIINMTTTPMVILALLLPFLAT